MQGGPQSSVQRKGAMARKSAGRAASMSPSPSPSSASSMKVERGARRKTVSPKVEVDGPATPIEKHMVEKPQWNSSTHVQLDQVLPELKVKTPRVSPPPVSESPKSARSVRSIRAFFETPRTEVVYEPPPPSPTRLRIPSKRLEWNGRDTGTPSVETRRSSQSSGASQSSVVSYSSVASQQSQPETFYDSLPTLEALELLDCDAEAPRSQSEELPKLELSFEGKPAPAPAHLRVRTSSTLPLQPEKGAPDSPAPSESPKAVPSPALLKLQAASALLGDGNNVREKVRSFSGRYEPTFTRDEGDRRAVKSFQGLPPPLISHSEPLRPESVKVDHHVKSTGLLRRMMHWGASKLGKKGNSKGSSGRKNGSGKDMMISQPTEFKRETQTQFAAEAEAKGVSTERENEETDVTVAENLDPSDSPRSSVSSVSTTYSDVSSKTHSHSHSRKHKKNVKSEILKSKLWLMRVHQKLQGRNAATEDDASAAPRAGVRVATLEGPGDASATEPTDKTMVTESARFNSDRTAISKLEGKHRRSSTWDAGKLSNATEDLFSPKQNLSKRATQGLLTPPRRLTSDTTPDFQQRRPTSLTTDSAAPPDPSPSPRKPRRTTDAPDVQRRRRPASMTTAESLAPREKSPSPRKPRLVNSRVAPDHQVSDSGSDTGSKSRRTNPRRGQTKQSAGAAPLSATTPSTTGTFLQTAALILATPGSKDEPNNQLFENSRKGAPPRLEESIATPPVIPAGISQQPSFKFNAPAHPLPIRVASPTSPVYPSARSPRSPEGQSTSTPTSPVLFAPSPIWSGMPSSPSSPGMFAPSPGSVEMQRSPGSMGFKSFDSTSKPSAHARGAQVSLDDISFTNLVKRPSPKNAQSSTDATTPAGVGSQKSPHEEMKSGSGEFGAPSSPRSMLVGLSFEQIVSGRDRAPPTDNTLMKFFFKCREIEHLNKFLALQKRRFLDSFQSAEGAKCFHMILSESGLGMSSMVSTLCTAWLLENTKASASVKWHPIPVMNMCQAEMWQHRDAAWLFHVCGIDASALLFLDEISLAAETVVAGRVKRAVTSQDILQSKDEVATSCTIVSEKFRQEAPKLLQARYMKTLLLAGILVDTKNLSTGSLRDKQQATTLLVGAGSLGRNGFYKHLVNIRDENYVTSFIKEIYGDSTALRDQPSSRFQAVEQLMSRPTSIIAAPEEPQKPTSTEASRKLEPELKVRTNAEPVSKVRTKSEPEIKARTKSEPEPEARTKSVSEAKSKVPSNRRGWFRSRPSAH